MKTFRPYDQWPVLLQSLKDSRPTGRKSDQQMVSKSDFCAKKEKERKFWETILWFFLSVLLFLCLSSPFPDQLSFLLFSYYQALSIYFLFISILLKIARAVTVAFPSRLQSHINSILFLLPPFLSTPLVLPYGALSLSRVLLLQGTLRAELLLSLCTVRKGSACRVPPRQQSFIILIFLLLFFALLLRIPNFSPSRFYSSDSLFFVQNFHSCSCPPLLPSP